MGGVNQLVYIALAVVCGYVSVAAVSVDHTSHMDPDAGMANHGGGGAGGWNRQLHPAGLGQGAFKQVALGDARALDAQRKEAARAAGFAPPRTRRGRRCEGDNDEDLARKTEQLKNTRKVFTNFCPGDRICSDRFCFEVQRKLGSSQAEVWLGVLTHVKDVLEGNSLTKWFGKRKHEAFARYAEFPRQRLAIKFINSENMDAWNTEIETMKWTCSDWSEAEWTPAQPWCPQEHPFVRFVDAFKTYEPQAEGDEDMDKTVWNVTVMNAASGSLDDLIHRPELVNEIASSVEPSAPESRSLYAKRFIAIMRQVMEGAKYLHSDLGILHEDVKSANLLYDTIKGTIYWMDYDTCCDMHKRRLPDGREAHDTEEGQLRFCRGDGGTEVYSPPQAGRIERQNQGIVLGSRDIFSVGLSIVEMLSGHVGPCGQNGCTDFMQVLYPRYSFTTNEELQQCVESMRHPSPHLLYAYLDIESRYDPERPQRNSLFWRVNPLPPLEWRRIIPRHVSVDPRQQEFAEHARPIVERRFEELRKTEEGLLLTQILRLTANMMDCDFRSRPTAAQVLDRFMDLFPDLVMKPLHSPDASKALDRSSRLPRGHQL
eukprot:GFYU01013135.1.p1 GENE.GFYU01013135.1~~GFYU01013135.1.p1  ORF type:complete len:606 (+),score=89.27 GFYU01013135.1:25-1818(+)